MTAPPRARDFGLPEPTPEDHAFWAPHLRDGESLLWAGRPPQDLVLIDGVQWFVVPLSFLIMLGGATLLLRVYTDTVSPETKDPLTGGVLALVMGSFGSWGHLWLDSRRRRATRYGLTTERAVVAVRNTVRSQRLTGDMTIESHLARDPGHVQIGPPGGRGYSRSPLGMGERSRQALLPFRSAQPDVFWQIPNPSAVRDLARAVRDAA